MIKNILGAIVFTVMVALLWKPVNQMLDQRRIILQYVEMSMDEERAQKFQMGTLMGVYDLSEPKMQAYMLRNVLDSTLQDFEKIEDPVLRRVVYERVMQERVGRDWALKNAKVENK